MDEAIKYISKIEIKGLFGDDKLRVWKLHPKVNILSGPNGSEKSTVLKYLYSVINLNIHPDEFLRSKINHIEVIFNNGKSISYTYVPEEKKYEVKPSHNVDRSTVYRDTQYKSIAGVKEIHKAFKKSSIFIDFIKPIDNELLTVETAQKFDSEIKTYLDWLIYLLQKKYLSYQVDLGKRALRLNGNNSEQKRQEISYPKERFIEILNEVFSYTGKYVDDTENEILFCLDDREISPYQLSSGEKQILIILLTTLVQDQQPSILFMDEPEISIHFDVQKKLIDYILELNPNVQIILATHSPAIIMGGWMDKVSEISDLIVHDNQLVLEHAE